MVDGLCRREKNRALVRAMPPRSAEARTPTFTSDLCATPTAAVAFHAANRLRFNDDLLGFVVGTTEPQRAIDVRLTVNDDSSHCCSLVMER